MRAAGSRVLLIPGEPVEHIRAPLLGDDDLPMTPSECGRRNVRVPPLPSPAQLPIDALDTRPDVPAFSSDSPHIEANPTPSGHDADALAGLDPDRRAAFLGGTIAEPFARMGDPL
jgi:hypothetical protein